MREIPARCRLMRRFLEALTPGPDGDAVLLHTTTNPMLRFNATTSHVKQRVSIFSLTAMSIFDQRDANGAPLPEPTECGAACHATRPQIGAPTFEHCLLDCELTDELYHRFRDEAKQSLTQYGRCLPERNDPTYKERMLLLATTGMLTSMTNGMEMAVALPLTAKKIWPTIEAAGQRLVAGLHAKIRHTFHETHKLHEALRQAAIASAPTAESSSTAPSQRSPSTSSSTTSPARSPRPPAPAHRQPQSRRTVERAYRMSPRKKRDTRANQRTLRFRLGKQKERRPLRRAAQVARDRELALRLAAGGGSDDDGGGGEDGEGDGDHGDDRGGGGSGGAGPSSDGTDESHSPPSHRGSKSSRRPRGAATAPTPQRGRRPSRQPRGGGGTRRSHVPARTGAAPAAPRRTRAPAARRSPAGSRSRTAQPPRAGRSCWWQCRPHLPLRRGREHGRRSPRTPAPRRGCRRAREQHAAQSQTAPRPRPRRVAAAETNGAPTRRETPQKTRTIDGTTHRGGGNATLRTASLPPRPPDGLDAPRL